MSSFKNHLVKGARIVLGGLALISLAACLRPLNAPGLNGASASQSLSTIEIAPLTPAYGQERLGHYLRSELIFDLDGSGSGKNKLYKLSFTTTERLQTPIVNTITGRAESASLIGEATYTLTSLDGSKVITSGKAVASASYDRDPQRFATIRAAREAEIRMAKILSEQIKIRLALALNALQKTP
jgi:LPS-assembly lipoprotein